MKFSVVITYLKEGSPDVLESIKQMNYPKKDYELLCLPGPGSPSIYRNKGADIGKGKIIAFIDDDAIVHKDLLKNAENFFNEHPEIDIVGGPQITPLGEKGFALISGYALSSKFGGWSTSNRYEKKKVNLNADDTYLTTAVMFCKKEVFQKIRFDENLFPGEDSKFVKEAKEVGFNIAYYPDLIVYHKRRPTIKKFIKQIFNYGKVARSRETFFGLLKRPFFLIPSIFLFYLAIFLQVILLSPASLKDFLGVFFGNFSMMSFAFLPLIIYLFLDIVFSFYESVKNKNIISIIPLLLIFPMLHLSYGAGLIYGYILGKKK